MTSRGHHDNAYLLHTRPYTDSKILVDYFCENSGLISGVQRLPRSRVRAFSGRQFVPLYVQWQGTGELKTIGNIEQIGPAVSLLADALYCGLYLNELLLRLIPKEEPHARLYSLYGLTLHSLSDNLANEESLRAFELTLLEELGYGFDFSTDIDGKEIPAQESILYCFHPERGFSTDVDNFPGKGSLFSGRILNAIGRRNFSDREVRMAVKKLCRQQINHLLGGKQLKSRELFLKIRDDGSSEP